MAAAMKPPPGSTSAALGMTQPADELQRELDERRKKAMQAAQLGDGKGTVSQLLMGATAPAMGY